MAPSGRNGALSACSIAEISEGEADAEIFGAAESDDGLQVVAVFPGYTDLALLQSALHFETLRFNRGDNLLRLVAIETLLDEQVLCRVAERRYGWVFAIHVAQVHAALAQFSDHDVVQTAQTACVLCGEFDFRCFEIEFDRGRAPFEIKTRGEFLVRLVDRVVEFLSVHLAGDVERRHGQRMAEMFEVGSYYFQRV